MDDRSRIAYNAYQREYQTRRYYERMGEARQILGGRCVECGTTENLHIDHIDPATKTKNLSEMHLWRRSKWLAELAKCQLLCSSHHGTKTAIDNGKIWLDPPHGRQWTYRKYGCRCDACVEANREHYRRYRRVA